jgi:NADH:ubiquinone oxidoreductase subunit 6 (subunit J)
VNDHPRSGGGTRGPAQDGARNAAHHAERAAQSPWARGVARAGFVFVGVLHVLIAWLALQVALGGSGNQADQSSAVQQIASAPGGPVLLWAGVLCCAALAVWMVIDAVAKWRREGKPTKAAGPGGTALAYFALTWLFVSFAIGNQKSSSQQSQQTTANVLSIPFGPVVLFIAGLVVLGIGVYFGFRGVTRGFLGKDAQPNEAAPDWVKVVGSVGYTAKGVAVAVLGILILVAAVRHDPSQQSGLDGALKGLAGQPFGTWILAVVALGLACYGVYSAARAKYGVFDR